MITRIKYQRNGNVLNSKNFVINHNLCVFIQIDCDTHELQIKCDDKRGQIWLELCNSVVAAKYKARKKLLELGMNFNREFRK
jgi:hypothetical protein